MSEGVSAPFFFTGNLCVSFHYPSLKSIFEISTQNLTFAAVLILLNNIIQHVSDSCTEFGVSLCFSRNCKWFETIT